MKFVILSNPRTGSEYLIRLLKKHSRVWCLGEVFSEGPDGERWNNSKYQKQKEPFLFLEQEYSGHDNKVCGYKQISYWLKNAGYSSPEEFILEHVKNNYQFIFMKRNNMLKEYISFMIMMEQRYGHTDRSDHQKKQIKLDPKIAYATLRKWDCFNNNCIQTFNDHGIPYLELIYEEDFDEDKKVKAKVFNFLNIGMEEIADPLKQTNPYPSNELVSNYQEIMDFLISKKRFLNKNIFEV